MKLKTEYENYSSVLVSGGMTILYFITYLGYSLYSLFPQLMAFGLMLVFIAFTVYAALNYKKQIIALLGLVGAYAVPFLLSTGSGRVDILFSYMAILNLGILVISLTQNWRALFYSAFGLTWLIFCGWYLTDYNQDTQFIFAFVFLSVSSSFPMLVLWFSYAPLSIFLWFSYANDKPSLSRLTRFVLSEKSGNKSLSNLRRLKCL